jgi:hypothetical protein
MVVQSSGRKPRRGCSIGFCASFQNEAKPAAATWSTGRSRAKERWGRGATLLERSALPAEFMQGGAVDALFGRVQVLQPAAPQRVRYL